MSILHAFTASSWFISFSAWIKVYILRSYKEMLSAHHEIISPLRKETSFIKYHWLRTKAHLLFQIVSSVISSVRTCIGCTTYLLDILGKAHNQITYPGIDYIQYVALMATYRNRNVEKRVSQISSPAFISLVERTSIAIQDGVPLQHYG